MRRLKGMTRRDLLVGAVSGGVLAMGGAAPAPAQPVSKEKEGGAFRISLNTSTLRGHKLPFAEVIAIAARAGYGGSEPWPEELDKHLASGGNLKEIDKRLKDHGLKVTGAIAFFEWMVDDEKKRAQALDDAKKRMEKLSQIGASHMAAPPAGDVANVDLLKAAERYRELLDASESFGVTPAVEVWGFAKNGYRLGQCALIALEAHHPKACVLPDVYHLYKGGSGFESIRHVKGSFLAGFHLNDYPASPPRETIRDSDRVYPGDGVAPLKQLFRDLREIGYQGALSIELFNPEYYKQ